MIRLVVFDTSLRYILETDNASLPSTNISRSVRLLYHFSLTSPTVHNNSHTGSVEAATSHGSHAEPPLLQPLKRVCIQTRSYFRHHTTRKTSRTSTSRLRRRHPCCERGLSNAVREQRTHAVSGRRVEPLRHCEGPSPRLTSRRAPDNAMPQLHHPRPGDQCSRPGLTSASSPPLGSVISKKDTGDSVGSSSISSLGTPNSFPIPRIFGTPDERRTGEDRS